MRLEEIVRQEPPLKLINMESVEVEEIKWLLYPFIPYGKVTIIQGGPGRGKDNDGVADYCEADQRKTNSSCFI